MCPSFRSLAHRSLLEVLLLSDIVCWNTTLLRHGRQIPVESYPFTPTSERHRRGSRQPAVTSSERTGRAAKESTKRELAGIRRSDALYCIPTSHETPIFSLFLSRANLRTPSGLQAKIPPSTSLPHRNTRLHVTGNDRTCRATRLQSQWTRLQRLRVCQATACLYQPGSSRHPSKTNRKSFVLHSSISVFLHEHCRTQVAHSRRQQSQSAAISPPPTPASATHARKRTSAVAQLA